MAQEINAQPTEKPNLEDEELSQEPEELGQRLLEAATEAPESHEKQRSKADIEGIPAPEPDEEEEE